MTTLATNPTHALVVGAGIGGLAAAAALARHTARVTVVDRDALPAHADIRPGVGQSAHIHQLLKGGEDSLERLLPGFSAALRRAGAVPMRVGIDIDFIDFGGPLPPVDAGFDVASLSRPAYEKALRDCVAALPNVSIRDDAPVRRLVIENGACTGVELEDGSILSADLVVDATGLNAPLAQQLLDDGHADFETENIRINVAYTTGRFAKPEKWRGENKGFFFLPAAPNTRFGLLLPVENEEWIVALGGRGANTPPRDLEGFLDYAARSDAPGIHERLSAAEPVAPLRTYRKAFATRRRFDRAAKWPARLIPIGDAMSSINPTYGQGMSVAALQADVLERRLAADPNLDALAAAYLPEAFAISDRAWSLAINSDYAYPETESPRPENFAMSRNIAAVLRKLCQTEPDFAIFRYRLAHMMEDASALRDGPLTIRFLTALQGSMAPDS